MAVKSGRAVPPRLLEPPPEVQMGLGLYMKGFFDLAGDRPQGGRIPWSTVRKWCEARGITSDDADDAWLVLSRMDIAYVEWARKKGKTLSAEADRENARRSSGIPTRVRR